MIRRTLLGAAAAIVALLVTACERSSSPTGPSSSVSLASNQSSASQALSAAPRSGALHLTKECSAYTGAAGSFCTVTWSSVKAIEVGTKVIYASAAGATFLESDITLDPPGPGNNMAFGHVHLDFATGTGLVTISGGTGKFSHLNARAAVSYLGGPNWAWNGTYGFDND